jgi:hypothetical protein
VSNAAFSCPFFPACCFASAQAKSNEANQPWTDSPETRSQNKPFLAYADYAMYFVIAMKT